MSCTEVRKLLSNTLGTSSKGQSENENQDWLGMFTLSHNNKCGHRKTKTSGTERKEKETGGGLSWTARKQELGIRQHERRALRVNIVPSLLIQGTSF